MMFLDASAIVAVLLDEPDSDELAKRIGDHKGKLITSPLSRFEATLAIAKAHAVGTKAKPTPQMVERASEVISDFLALVKCRETVVAEGIGTGAIRAAATYGKIVGHKADLNFGDCFSYASAKAFRAGLIYKGNDFSETDLA